MSTDDIRTAAAALTQNVAATYPNRSAADEAHQQDHDGLTGVLGTIADEIDALSGTYGVLDEVRYLPASLTTLSTTSTTSADVSTTNLAVSFDAPDAGEVVIEMEAYADSGTAGVTYLWHLRDGSGEVANTQAVVTRNNNGARVTHTVRLTGLTPGQTYSYKWGHKLGGAATGRILCGPPYGEARMTAKKG